MKNINRRTVLKGTSGVLLTLPWLEAFAETKATTPTIKTAFMFMPNGVHPERWTPAEEGKNYKMSQILAPLEPHRNDFDILTNLNHKNARTGDGHYAKTANLLSGEVVTQTSGKNIKCGISADQVIARFKGKKTALPSIELGIEPTRTGVDTNVGFTQVYGGHISWSSPSTPMPKEIYPQLAFDRLFNNSSTNENLVSILDDIQDEAKTLKKYLGAEDSSRMDEFMTSVRSLENRIQKASQISKEEHIAIPAELRPENGLPAKTEQHMQLMLDIIVMAFQMNRTHTATFMFGNSVSGKNFSFLDGVNGGFHEISHHTNKPEKMEMYAKINVFHMQMFAHFLAKMKLVKEGDRTLLDNSLIMIASGLRDGNQHDPKNIPVLLAGKGGKNIDRGNHRVLPVDSHLCNLLLGMIQANGINLEKFGDSNASIC